MNNNIYYNINSLSFAANIRKHCLQMTYKANASHVGSALSITDVVSVLFTRVMNLNPKNPKWIDRDRLILSKGHACCAIYAALGELLFFDVTKLQSYGVDHSIYMTHISHKVPGVEFSTGSLGHGLPFGTGKALAAKKQQQNWRTFVLMSDGELDEGSNWEAFLFAAHHQLDNLIAIVDYNKLQSLTSVAKTLNLEPLADKFHAFGWSVREVDGHDHGQLTAHLSTVPWQEGKPSVLITHTTKGKGVSFMENSVDWHYKSPSAEQLAQALEELSHA